MHETETCMVEVPPHEVDALAEITLRVKVSCARSCDLRDKVVRIIDQEGVVAKEAKLTSFDGAINETDGFTVKAPINPGAYTWRALFRAQGDGEVEHQESSTAFSFTVKPHATSMAVWEVPSPVSFDAKFKINVGVKCFAECELTDKKIEVFDHMSEKVATMALGTVPWPGTSALYWTEVELEAPSVEEYFTWKVRFPGQDLKVPHGEAFYTFGFRTVRPPEHVVTVKVVDRTTGKPIKDAYVLLDTNRATTDEGGVARLGIAKGSYELIVAKDDYLSSSTTIEVTADVTVESELLYAPAPPGGY